MTTFLGFLLFAFAVVLGPLLFLLTVILIASYAVALFHRLIGAE